MQDTNGSVAKAIRSLAKQVQYLGNGDAGSTFGAIEGHAVKTYKGAELIANGLEAVAQAINNLAETLDEGRQ